MKLCQITNCTSNAQFIHCVSGACVLRRAHTPIAIGQMIDWQSTHTHNRHSISNNNFIIASVATSRRTELSLDFAHLFDIFILSMREEIELKKKTRSVGKRTCSHRIPHIQRRAASIMSLCDNNNNIDEKNKNKNVISNGGDERRQLRRR